MNIWIVNPFDDVPGEGKAQRYWALADALSEQGHQVVWWSSNWSHRRKARRVAPKCQSAKGQLPTINDQPSIINFTLRLVATPPYYKNVSVGRLWNHFRFGRNLFRDACLAVEGGELEKPDIVLASMPPMDGAAVALKLKAKYGCKVITDIMDLWPDTLLQAVLKYSAKDTFTYKLLEHVGRIALYPYWRMLRRACVESDAISAQSNAFAEYAKKHGATGEVHVCYLGAEGATGATCGLDSRNRKKTSTNPSLTTEATQTEVFSAEDPDLPLSNLSTFPQRSLRLLYLGAMGASYDLHTVIDAVRMLNETKQGSLAVARLGDWPRVECVFVGDGEKRSELEAMNVQGVRFTGFLNGAELTAELETADLGVIPFFSGSGVTVPYKAGEYLAHGLPVLSTIDGELGDLIREFECGAVYRSSDVDSLVASIAKYIDQAELLGRSKENASACFLHAFDRQKLYPDFASWISEQRALGNANV